MKKTSKIILAALLLLMLSYSMPTRALSPLTPKAKDPEVTNAFVDGSGFQKYNGANGVVDIINIAITGFLSVLGIIFIIIMVVAGYNYMNAQGDEKKVSESLKSIKHAVIGLLIVISAYSITYFVFSNLPGGRTVGGGYSTEGGSQ